jgi:hypothetical protein
MTQKKAITTYWLDVLLVGGISIVFFLGVLLLSEESAHQVLSNDLVWLTVLINYPHFLLSYRLIYRPNGGWREHPWATLYFPGIMLVCVVAAVALAPWDQRIGAFFGVATGVYLGWHYCGQAWGMVATFSILDDRRLDPVERGIIKWSIHLFFIYHTAYFMSFQTGLPEPVMQVLFWAHRLASLAVPVATLAGLYGFWRLKKRTGQLPSLRMVLPFVAIVLWYATLAQDVKALFWIQISHALQYLAFPMRVEGNRYSEKGKVRGKLVQHQLIYAAIIVAISVAGLFYGVNGLADFIGSVTGKTVMGAAFSMMFMAAFNMHHFFIDQVAWKLRNPAVQGALFAHLKK